ncbi:MAG: hypothetical protein ABI789_02225 [Usitatibacter sp.]
MASRLARIAPSCSSYLMRASEGRKDAVLSLKTRAGRIGHLLPLALTTVVEEAAGEHRLQIAQSAPDHLVIRMDNDVSQRRRA